MAKLLLQSLLSFLVGAALLGAVLFLFAGTLHYGQAWVFIVVFSASANDIGIYGSVSKVEMAIFTPPVQRHSG